MAIPIITSDQLASSSRRRSEVCLAERGWFRIFDRPPDDDCAIPFLRVIGSLREWSAGLITAEDLARCLHKAARELVSD